MKISAKDDKQGGWFYIDVGVEMNDIELRLGALKDKAPAVLTKALNDTARWAGRKIASSAQARYRIQKTKFAKEFRLHRASKSSPEAVLYSSGRAISAPKFKISPLSIKNSPKGSQPVKMAILKKSSPQTVTSNRGKNLQAFVAKFDSDHIAVVQRDPKHTYKPAGWAIRQGRWHNYFETRHKLDNSRIKELYGPSVPKMLETAGVLEQFIGFNQSEVLEHLQQMITKHINTELYFASKGGMR